MANDNPDTVEQWAPLFLQYFKKEQILDPKFSLTFNHCKLCDAHVDEPAETHMKKHRKELTAFLAKRRRAAEARSQAGLKKHRRERELEAAVLGGDNDDE